MNQRIPVEKSPDGTVNFRERFHYTAVEAGEVLARKHPAGTGHYGNDVFGNKVPPPEPLQAELIAGQGCVISDDGIEAIAVIPAVPLPGEKETKFSSASFPLWSIAVTLIFPPAIFL